MKISYNWLKDYVKFDLTPEKTAEILTSIGLEVEAMETVEQIPGGLEGVVVAEVIECSKHPDADKLSVTKVNAGGDGLLQIVCGAPNVAAGQKVLLATIGTRLVFPDGEQIKIKKSKIRGIESFGMICAEDELGLGNSHDGIMVLDGSAVPGTPAKDYLGLESDTVFEIGLTPNRVDAASHIGVARDLYAYLKYNGYDTELVYPSVAEFREGEGKGIDICVEAGDAAPRYSGITLTDVKIGPSPDWMKKRLNAVGIRSINNVVDITNFVLQEVGLPLHAFDASKIDGDRIVVRHCEEGTDFVTLDGVHHSLSPEDLMICNENSPMCLAGIFGGLESGIKDNTEKVFIESAYFNPVYIRKSSKRHGIKTDASFRYERGADPSIIPYALKRAALLLQEHAGAKVVGPVKEIYPSPIEKKKVSLDIERMKRFIGKDIPSEDIKAILRAMDFEILSENGSEAEVSVPTYRVDVYRECDVVEDVLRIYGFNNIELPENVKSSVNVSPNPDPETMKKTVSDMLSSNGFSEIMNNSLTKAAYYEKLAAFPKDRLVMILNPLSSDLNAMRQTLIPGGLEVIAYNQNRQCQDLKLYELGNVYSISPDADKNIQKSYKEHARLSLFMTGEFSHTWRGAKKSDFFVLKGYVELIMKRLGADLNSMQYDSAPSDIYSEGITYKSRSGTEIVSLGIISPALRRRFGIKTEVYAAEISWDELCSIASKNRITYKEMPKYPEVRRDLALLVDENVRYADLRKAAFECERKLLRAVDLFDVYKGDKIAEGKKQYAMSFILRDDEKTLTDKAVEGVMSKITETLSSKFGASLR